MLNVIPSCEQYYIANNLITHIVIIMYIIET